MRPCLNLVDERDDGVHRDAALVICISAHLDVPTLTPIVGVVCSISDDSDRIVEVLVEQERSLYTPLRYSWISGGLR
jgi:hypothetical protein